MVIRDAVELDVKQISELMIRSAREFFTEDFTAAGMAVFIEDCAVAALEKRIREGDRFYVAVSGSVIAGVCVIRRGNHLYSLFTDKAFHRRGIARDLWQRALDDIRKTGAKEVTVKASNYALPAYERLGFVCSGARQEAGGIVSNPMIYRIVG